MKSWRVSPLGTVYLARCRRFGEGLSIAGIERRKVNASEKKALFEELEHEIQFYSPATQMQYRSHVWDYLGWLKDRDWRDRETLYKYLDYLKHQGKSQVYISYIVRGPIGCLFRMNGLRVPVKLPKVKSPMIDLASRFSYTVEEIRALIQAAKGSGNPQWANLMALSTTYGLRVGEIFAVRKDDTHPYKKTVVIHTEKGGMLREHLVPDQVALYIFHYDYPMVGYNRRFDIFREITTAAGVKHVPKKAYHGIRHGLATALDELRDAKGKRVLDQTRIYQFLRWKGGGMMQIYTTPQMFDIDEEIFQHHPFLKEWE
jgi:integrase